jgi:hypothetical protein
MLRLLSVFIVAILIASCAAQQQTQSQPSPQKTDFKKCPEQRSQICTREYMPVCATRDTGVRCVTTPCPSSEQKTYSNGCDACADEKVLGYITNACTQDVNTKEAKTK